MTAELHWCVELGRRQEKKRDDFDEAQKKIKQAEVTSDLQTGNSEDKDTSDEEESENELPRNKRVCPRPPNVKIPVKIPFFRYTNSIESAAFSELK
ncbi:hypothetical protein NQ318_007683 [Aromia moschata]|uniref:Uncharacterized protein n=1 Tax=Aromia moschata TaxID=1265417 RepID=A0AAV8XKC6_9CUCU|nr:hypothetical protein NQ318_007683 [Aromia moschata]